MFSVCQGLYIVHSGFLSPPRSTLASPPPHPPSSLTIHPPSKPLLLPPLFFISLLFSTVYSLFDSFLSLPFSSIIQEIFFAVFKRFLAITGTIYEMRVLPNLLMCVCSVWKFPHIYGTYIYIHIVRQI